MRIWKTFAVVVLLAGAAAVPSVTNAQGAAPAAQPTRVGVIDIGYIFANHPTMKTKIEAIDTQIQAEEQSINTRREAILKDLEKLRMDYKEETADYRKLEEKIASAESELKLEFVRKEKEFAEAKARVLMDTYKEVRDAVKSLSDYNQISVVFRYTKDEMDAKKPASVTQGIGRDIVYFNGSIDMTAQIMQMLTPQTATAPQATRR